MKIPNDRSLESTPDCSRLFPTSVRLESEPVIQSSGRHSSAAPNWIRAADASTGAALGPPLPGSCLATTCATKIPLPPPPYAVCTANRQTRSLRLDKPELRAASFPAQTGVRPEALPTVASIRRHQQRRQIDPPVPATTALLSSLGPPWTPETP